MAMRTFPIWTRRDGTLGNFTNMKSKVGKIFSLNALCVGFYAYNAKSS